MSGSSDDFELFDESRAQVPPKRRGRTAIVLIVIALILAAVAVWADVAARAAAEGMVESELADRLPDGAGTEATIGGFALLPQFFSGSLDDLDVSFSLDGDSVPSLAGDNAEAGSLTIADGQLTHNGAVEFLGMEVGFAVSLEPSVEGGAVVLTPTAIEATTDVASVDLGQLVDLEAMTMRVCAASLLPESMELTSVDVVGSRLRFAVSGTDVPVNLAELRTRGSCE